MSKASTLCFRVTLIVAIVCCAVVAGHADIIPELTGDFIAYAPTGGLPDGRTGVPLYLPTGGFSGALMFLAPPANLPSKTTTTCTDPNNCVIVTIWDGSAIGGPVSMSADIGGQTINMTGVMTGGSIFGQNIICDNPFFPCFDWQWDFSFSFRGSWSNSWFTEGEAGITMSPGDTGETRGTVSMTTSTTPEPGTIVLLSSGIVFGWRSWRRRSRV